MPVWMFKVSRQSLPEETLLPFEVGLQQNMIIIQPRHPGLHYTSAVHLCFLIQLFMQREHLKYCFATAQNVGPAEGILPKIVIE